MAKDKKRNILITGATGFLGLHLTKELLKCESNRIYVLIRPSKEKTFNARKEELCARLSLLTKSDGLLTKIKAIEGDIEKENFGLRPADFRRLECNIDTIYHLAAICNFDQRLDDIRRVNLCGTETILNLAHAWLNRGSFRKFNHVSTVYVAGKTSGVFFEDGTPTPDFFNNSYEESKFEAELSVEKYRKMGLNVSIFRPSIIIDTIPPSSHVAPGLIRLLAMFILEFFDKIPADEDTELNMIPVDVAARMIVSIASSDKVPENSNYNIVNPQSIKLGSLLDQSSSFFGFNKPKCIPLNKFRMADLSKSQHRVIRHFMPYLNQKLVFDMKNSLSALKEKRFEIRPLSTPDLIKTFEYYGSKGIIPHLRRQMSR